MSVDIPRLNSTGTFESPTAESNEPLEDEHEQHERAEPDGIHQRAAVVHHVQQILGWNLPRLSRLFGKRILGENGCRQKQRARQRANTNPSAQRHVPHNELPCYESRFFTRH